MTAIAEDVDQFANFGQVVVIAENTSGNVELSNVEFTIFPSNTIVVTLSAPTGVTVTANTLGPNIVCNIFGAYGDIAADDLYQVVDIVNDVGVVRTFFDFNQLNAASYDHLIDFSPQDWSYAEFKYNFTVNVGVSSFVTVMTQEVYPNMNRHISRIENLIQKERTA